MVMTGDRVRITRGAHEGRVGDVTSVLVDRDITFYQVTLSKTAESGEARMREVCLCRQDELEEITA